MPTQVYHQFDDPYTDPELVRLMILLGKTPFWEVQLALGEFNEVRTGSNPSTTANTTTYGVNVTQVQIVRPTIGCPTLSQFVWAMEGEHPVPIRARKLPYMIGERLYQPITGKSNEIKKIEIVDNQPLYRIATDSYASVVSTTHKILRMRDDPIGHPVCHHRIGSDVCAGGVNEMNETRMVRKQPAGRGKVVKIWLDGDHIYLTGDSAEGGIGAHNLKDPGDVS